MTTVQNFYYASYLISQGITMQDLYRDEQNQLLYSFDASSEIISQKIRDFRDNNQLQKFTDAIVELRHTRHHYLKSQNKTEKPVEE